MNQLEKIHRLIDFAYDCDVPELVPALEAKLAAIKASAEQRSELMRRIGAVRWAKDAE